LTLIFALHQTQRKVRGRFVDTPRALSDIRQPAAIDAHLTSAFSSRDSWCDKSRMLVKAELLTGHGFHIDAKARFAEMRCRRR
jgi:hypothetical protein